MKAARLEMNYLTVQAHFEKCLRLLICHGSHQDATSILSILALRSRYFQRFQLPLEIIKTAHAEFEQYRQFYSGMENFKVDNLVVNIYRTDDLRLAPPAGVVTSNELDFKLMQLRKY